MDPLLARSPGGDRPTLGTLGVAFVAAGALDVPIDRLLDETGVHVGWKHWLGALAVVGLFGWIAADRLNVRLRERHAAVWRRVGAPARPWLGGLGAQLRLLAFLVPMDFLSLRDRRVDVLGTLLLLGNVMALVVLALAANA